jgi:peroxiredoxin
VLVVLVVASITAFAVSSGGGDNSNSAPAGSSTPKPASGSTKTSPTVKPFVDTATSAAIGQPAPNFLLKTLDGKSVSLADLRGRPVIVNFWASWCNPCRKEFPLLKATLAKYHLDKLAVVGVSFQDIDSDARHFAAQQHSNWPLAVDSTGAAAKVYGVRAAPTTFFIDPDGKLADEVYGQLPGGKDLQQSLDKILQVHALS